MSDLNGRYKLIELSQFSYIYEKTVSPIGRNGCIKRFKGECKMKKNILKQRELPDYYNTMYLDGYTPEEILQAQRNTMYKEFLGGDEENVTINVEVKKK